MEEGDLLSDVKDVYDYIFLQARMSGWRQDEKITGDQFDTLFKIVEEVFPEYRRVEI